MSNEERASPLDLLRAGVTQGKQRVQVHNLKNEQSQLDKRRTQAVVELGEQVWQQRVKHPDYSPTFAQLVKLEQQRTGLQSQLDELLMTISQQERLKGQLNEGFAARIDSVQAQKRATVARLSKVMSRKQAAEQRLGEGQEPNTAEIEPLNGEQQAIQSEISQHESEITAIQDEQARTIRPIEEQLSQLQKQVRTIKEQVTALVSQMKPIMPVLGERVLTVRPEAAQLAEAYQQIDALDRQLAQKAEQIATLEQQITTASPTAKRVFYLLVGTAGTLALLLLLVFCVLIVSALRGEGVAVGGSRPQPQVGADADGDWVSDLDEAKFGTNESEWDSDGDGAPDFEEIFIVGSDPTVAEDDSDEDYFRDVTEKKLHGTDPNVADEDRDWDLVPDSVELKRGSDPGKADTDGDLLGDYLELYLTNTDPAVADPINEQGFPEALEPWLPEHLKNAACQAQVGASIDELRIIDPEEADEDDIVAGDDAIILYGLWLNAQQEDDLFFKFSENTAHREVWQSGGLEKGDKVSRFSALAPLPASCGDSVTFAIQAIETDAPWGGDRNFGLYRDEIQLIFKRIPMEWSYYGPSGMSFEGTGGDSGTYLYEIDYTITLELER